MKVKSILLLCCVLVLYSFTVIHAQSFRVTGTVTSKNTGQPLSGAAVTVKGTTTGTSTDSSGKYSISVSKSNTVLTVSYVGATEQQITVERAGTYNVQLDETVNSMDEVVVVGYGTQRKSVVTGAISSVKAKDLENVPNGRIEQSLQGRVAGVTISQAAGQPGSGSTIRVRGVTTFGDGNNNPLWVVDGVVVDAGGIGYLNQSDIESIEVLKDATSAAIYGTRAAAGVILVTTKKGRSGKLVVSYNGFYGTSSPAKKLDLLNATEYATLINERSLAGGGSIVYANPAGLGKGTDWQDQIFNNDARRYNHELSLSGGNERSTFYLSVGIQNQEGIVATDISNYNKKTIRLNSTHKIGKYVTFGETVGYTHQKSMGLGNTNSEFGGPLSSAINLDPITPVIQTDPAILAQAPYLSNTALILASNGYPYAISNNVGQEMSNPKAYIQTRLGNYGWSDDIVGNAYIEVSPTKNIRIRSSVSGKLSYYGSQYFTPVFYLSPTISATQNSYGKNTNNAFNWNIENTIQYSKVIGNHDFSVLLGQGAYVDNNGGGSTVVVSNLPVNNYQDASFNFPSTQANRTDGVSDLILHKITSLFGRINYNYKEKYLFTGIARRDGSTRFGANNKFGNFPSASVGWVASKEDFWPENNYVKTLKIRGGYGKVGNDAIPDFGYTPLVVGGYNYTLGSGGNIVTGYAPKTLANPDLHWEETSQADIGLDAQLFNNFTLTVDVYNKKTSGILRQVPIPLYVGVSDRPAANIADMENRGLEIELGYRKRLGQVDFGVNGNVSFLKNKVTYINSDADFIDGDASFQSMGAVTRTQVGQSYNSFFGYQSLGIFQTQADVNAYTNKGGSLIQPNAKPGDFRWQDMNGDGAITEADRSFLGTSIPKTTFGLTLTASFKGFDIMAFGQGAAGNKIFQGLRRLDIATANYQTKALNRWTGPGTSNDYPRLTSNDANGNFTNMSDFYLEKGDYLRLKVVQIGYTFNIRALSKLGNSKLRLYVTAENLATLTNYTGYDPEIGGGVFGIDKGYYPQARSVLFGAQVQF